MKLENIMKEWEEDAPIDNQNLDGESIKIPNLHAKYMEMYTKEKRTLREFKRKWKVLFQKRWEAVIGVNFKLDLGSRANPNGKRERSISAALLRTWRQNGIESVFSISSKKLSIHANVSQKEMGWVCLSFQ